MKQLTHLSLFSGIGGLDLAAEMAGIKTVGQCEWAEYPSKILEKHWPDVPRWKDIRTLTKESFYERTGLSTIDVISGGFPCQPFSVAGERKGKEDDRYLWPEMLRVIQELQPTWVLGENVPGIVNLALDTVLSDLENEGYASQAFIVPACGVDAPHRRNRVAILAYFNGKWDGVRRSQKNASKNGRQGFDNSGRATENDLRLWWENKSATHGVVDGLQLGVYKTASDSDSITIQERSERSLLDSKFKDCSSRERERERERKVPSQSERTAGMHTAWEDWPDEPGVDRVVDGLPNRMDRIRCLGNAVVPQQFYPFFDAIVKVEEELWQKQADASPAPE